MTTAREFILSKICTMKKVFIFLFTLSIQVPFAQNSQIKFDHLSLIDGLSQSSVRCIIQDHNGFMWFGTLDGLNKFDGYAFYSYFHNHKDTNSLNSNIINALFEDEGNKLFVGTSLGLAYWDGITEKFIRMPEFADKNIIAIGKNSKQNLWVADNRNIYYDENGKLSVFPILEKNTDKKITIKQAILYQGNIWLVTNSGLAVLDISEKQFRFFHFQDKEATLLFETRNSQLWMGSNQGLFTVDYQNNNFLLDKISVPCEESVRVTGILEEKDGRFWIGTKEHGLIFFNRYTNDCFSCINNPSQPNSMSVNHILSIFVDRSNILWVGTKLGGINKWNRAAEELLVFRKNPFNPNSLSSNLVRTIFEDPDGTVWIGTVDGGLNKWNQKTGNFIHFEHNPKDPASLPDNHVRAILRDSCNRLWVGTHSGGLSLFNEKTGKFKNFTYNSLRNSISDNHIWRIIEDHAGNLWIATNGGGLNKYNVEKSKFSAYKHDENNPKSLSSNNVSTVFEDSKHRLWVGTLDEGLNLLNTQDGTFFHFKYNQSDSNAISHNRIYSIVETANHTIWIGTKEGLNKWNETTQNFTSYTIEDGLPNNVVMGILEDTEHNLWISTNKGIAKFNPQKGEVLRCFNIKDGLQDNEFLIGSFFKDQKDRMFFGGVDGFNVFNPEKLKDNPNIPPVVITGFQIFNKPVQLDTAISMKKELFLTYRDRIFSFDFVALDYVFPEKNQYKIKLEGFNNNWLFLGTKRYISFTNIPAGDYRLRVLGSNNDGKWNSKGTSLIIHIAPPWWNTLWFKIAVILLIVISIFVWVKLRERKLKRDKRILEEKVKRRTATIREQKEEIEAKNEELSQLLEEVRTQRDEIESQKIKIETVHKEVSQSIAYAKRIQETALPKQILLEKNLTDFFILFKPKDVVSGDFYWWTEIEGQTVITVADCTGHGVPGAFMSMLGISFLREIVVKENITDADIILNRLRKEIIFALKQKGVEGEQKDGMDMALISINHETNVVQFAGANNPLYIIKPVIAKAKPEAISTTKAQQGQIPSPAARNDDYELIEVKPDKMPIAIYDKMDKFTTHEIQLQKGDQLYLLSDGFADQFGGPKNKKFKYKPFKKLLLDNAKKPMAEQKQVLEQTFAEWKSGYEQIDDITIVGIKI